MPATPSTMLALGASAADFHLPNVVTGEAVSLKDYSGAKALLVAFVSPHCPFVKHIQQELGQIARDYSDRGLHIAAISSNDAVAYPADSLENLKIWAQEQDYSFWVLFDEEQSVAKAYNAACTPDFFLFGADHKLVYRGQLDDSRPKNELPVTGKDLRAAIDAVLSGQSVSQEQRASIGCNIKWKAGNEPSYFQAPAPALAAA
ncbi:thioredoxin family protein [Capsulimonas corticalis]|uniref:Thioredoxin family protein n=1 Tax=Capsulimonas corticalis TaxID=2219043 RepID=A0A402CWK6_9BACT|nr:thioredoxin family protein [Capsulimonas corticalis]BDI34210.1 thioredoxin family protein [Capsulimonas corticalis]